LLGMKGRFLRLQISDQRPKSFNRDLIGNCQKHFLIMLDPFVELDALATHWNPFEQRTAQLVKRVGR